VRLVVVTLGAQGALAAHGTHRVTAPATTVKVVDTIGAGDAFGAALIAWLRDHGALRLDMALDAPQLRDALEFACRAASITCSRAGADPPSRREMALSR
jgi:fructokinase